MKSQFVIFVIIGTLLVAAIYSASTNFVFAVDLKVGNLICYKGSKDSSVMYCANTENKTIHACELDANGKVIPPCTQLTKVSPNVTPGLIDALDAATQESQNTTKVPKGSFLNDGGLLTGQGDNQTTSQRIVDPEDRFCMQGTGGTTGKACVPCEPGQFECTDVLTGGPLDMQTAPSESGKSNDTKSPKDLGGLNNDDNGPQFNPGE